MADIGKNDAESKDRVDKIDQNDAGLNLWINKSIKRTEEYNTKLYFKNAA